MKRIPRSLAERLRDRHVIPFVGAGVSMAVERADGGRLFPSWAELLLRGAKRLEEDGKPDDAGLIRAFLRVKPPRYLDAAQHLRDKLGPLAGFLKDEIDVAPETASEPSLRLAKAVWGLGSRLIITTNYDRVLQWACPRELARDLGTWDIQATASKWCAAAARARGVPWRVVRSPRDPERGTSAPAPWTTVPVACATSTPRSPTTASISSSARSTIRTGSRLVRAVTGSLPADTAAVARSLARLAESTSAAAAAWSRRGGLLDAADAAFPSAAAERRLVTVLSCQLMAGDGSGRPLEAEQLLAAEGPFRDLALPILDRRGAHLAERLDGLTAYFGFPRAREDDAHRGVAAALELAAAVERWSAGASAGGPAASVSLRAGVDTGSVVCTTRPDGRRQVVTGRTGCCAAEIGMATRSGAVLVSAATHRVVRRRFRCEPPSATALCHVARSRQRSIGSWRRGPPATAARRSRPPPSSAGMATCSRFSARSGKCGCGPRSQPSHCRPPRQCPDRG